MTVAPSVIDSHQHFWRLDRGDYDWLTADLGAIYRDFGPDDLAPLLGDTGVERTVLVQAAPTVAETHYMLSIADSTDFVGGVVGWIDMAAPDPGKTLDTLQRNPHFKGIRPMIQVIEDPAWMLSPRLDAAFKALIERELTFDALVTPVHLANLHALVKRYPDLKVVIDHGAKPNIAAGQFDDWAEAIAAVARDSNACCKLSGLVTEAASDWTVDDLVPYTAHLLEAFGPDRLMWGSDWPVLTLAGSYDAWWQASEALLAPLSAGERAAIMGGTATRFYDLG